MTMSELLLRSNWPPEEQRDVLSSTPKGKKPPDTDSVRKYRSRHHKAGDHSFCLPKRCPFARRGTIARADLLAMAADMHAAADRLETLAHSLDLEAAHQGVEMARKAAIYDDLKALGLLEKLGITE